MDTAAPECRIAGGCCTVYVLSVHARYPAPASVRELTAPGRYPAAGTSLVAGLIAGPGGPPCTTLPCLYYPALVYYPGTPPAPPVYTTWVHHLGTPCCTTLPYCTLYYPGLPLGFPGLPRASLGEKAGEGGPGSLRKPRKPGKPENNVTFITFVTFRGFWRFRHFLHFAGRRESGPGSPKRRFPARGRSRDHARPRSRTTCYLACHQSCSWLPCLPCLSPAPAPGLPASRETLADHGELDTAWRLPSLSPPPAPAGLPGPGYSRARRRSPQPARRRAITRVLDTAFGYLA